FGNAGEAVILETVGVESPVPGVRGSQFGYFQAVDRAPHQEQSKAGGKVKAQKGWVARLCLAAFGYRSQSEVKSDVERSQINQIASDLWNQRGSTALNGRRVVINVATNKNGFEELTVEPYVAG